MLEVPATIKTLEQFIKSFDDKRVQDNFRQFLLENLSKILKSYKEAYGEDSSFADEDAISSSNDEKAQKIELFSRICYGAAPYSKFEKDDLSDFYISFFNSTLIKGVDPSSTDYWGEVQDYDQRCVEMFPLLLMLTTNQDQTWETYSPDKKRQITQWMLQINGVKLVQNNWIFFPILVNSFLAKLNHEREPENKNYWNFINSCYLGDGWYSDGPKGKKDYYISFAFQFYSLIYSYFFKDSQKRSILLERAVLFASQYIYFCSPEGQYIPYGRSLIYRFAQSSFWAALALNNLFPYSKGQILGIIKRNLVWWSKQRICHKDGTLNLGYCYDNQYLTENYNSEGSPYWALKPFIVLLLDPSDSFWSTTPLPLPNLNSKLFSPHGSFLILRNENDICLYPIDHTRNETIAHSSEKYMSFCYNSTASFNIEKDWESLENIAPDSSLLFSFDGLHFFRRLVNQKASSDGTMIVETWSPVDGVFVNSYLLPIEGSSHVRIHAITSKNKSTALDFGFPLENPCTVGGNCLKNKRHAENLRCFKGNGVFHCNHDANNTNILFPHTSTPFLQFEIKRGKNILVDYFGLDAVEEPKIAIRNSSISITFAGKTIWIKANYPQEQLFMLEKVIALCKRKLRKIKSFLIRK